jgi:Icc-related predicted phosphoesterase
MTTVFFATDVHGSDVCWKKFINAGKFYEAQVLILGGDMTGKAIIPLVKQANGAYKVTLLDQETLLEDEDEVARMEKIIANRGYYPMRLDPDQLDELSTRPESIDELFVQQAVETMQRWVDHADQRLKGSGIKCFVCPGQVLKIDDHYVMISTGWTTPTPWHTFRECSEDELRAKIEAMASQVEDMEHCIFNIHNPPYGSGLDEAPELDAELRPMYAGRSLVPVGSRAVKEVLEKYQPPLALCGHIHEGKGMAKIGRTLCINPGSMYEQGMLLGTLVKLDKSGVKQYMLTSG